MLAPPVAEEILVRALADLHHCRAGLAHEAREEYRAERTTEIVETDDGRLAPG